MYKYPYNSLKAVNNNWLQEGEETDAPWVFDMFAFPSLFLMDRYRETKASSSVHIFSWTICCGIISLCNVLCLMLKSNNTHINIMTWLTSTVTIQYFGACNRKKGIS
jgi:hypothetical protein